MFTYRHVSHNNMFTHTHVSHNHMFSHTHVLHNHMFTHTRTHNHMFTHTHVSHIYMFTHTHVSHNHMFTHPTITHSLTCSRSHAKWIHMPQHDQSHQLSQLSLHPSSHFSPSHLLQGHASTGLFHC